MADTKTLREIQQLYRNGVNVMQLFRQQEPGQTNSLNSIEISYDLQAGSYVEALQTKDRSEYIENYTRALASVLNRYRPASIMEAGTGEATTLTHLLRHMDTRPARASGFDLSWSRIAVARRYAAASRVALDLALGDLSNIPAQNNSIEIVFTSHSIEPNPGREKEFLRELFRVAQRYVILLEPSNELGNEATKQHIDKHMYCTDLARHAEELDFKIIEHRLFDYSSNPANQTALIVIEKSGEFKASSDERWGCPACKGALQFHSEHYFCPECLVVYPVIGHVPCLTMKHAIVATRYLELS